MEKRRKPLRVSRAFEQVNCPNSSCSKVVLSPYVDFHPHDDRAKERHGQCIACGKALLFSVKPIGPIEVRLYGEIINPESYAYAASKIFALCTGVQPVTELAVMLRGDGVYEARKGIAIMGNSNFASSHGANPFDPNFHDNYCVGKGASVEEALIKLKDDLEHLSGTLFA